MGNECELHTLARFLPLTHTLFHNSGKLGRWNNCAPSKILNLSKPNETQLANGIYRNTEKFDLTQVVVPPPTPAATTPFLKVMCGLFLSVFALATHFTFSHLISEEHI